MPFGGSLESWIFTLDYLAIALHNRFEETISLSTHPLACLLRICDELQEWDRKRINIEKIIKNLYIDIQEGHSSDFSTYELLDSMKVNISMEVKKENSFPVSIEPVFDQEGHPFCFSMRYRDAVSGHFEPTMTLLSKTYNLQHLDLTSSNDNTLEKNTFLIAFSISLHFPVPREYGIVSEYEIYSLFCDKYRQLPLLTLKNAFEKGEPGLFLIRDCDFDPSRKTDYFCINLQGKTWEHDTKGRLNTDPSKFFNQFIEWKKEALIRKSDLNRVFF